MARSPGDQSAIDELHGAFISGKVFRSSPEDRERFLKALGGIDPNNQDPKTTAVVRALIINHLQMAATIDKLEATITKLNAENGKVSRWVAILTVVCAIGTVIQAVIACVFFMRGG